MGTRPRPDQRSGAEPEEQAPAQSGPRTTTPSRGPGRLGRAFRFIAALNFALAVAVTTWAPLRADARRWAGLVAGGLLAWVLAGMAG